MPLKTLQDEQPSINLTSMIDVLFLLIIFFMVGTRFSDMEGNLDVELPKVSEGGQPRQTPRAHVVSVRRDGSLLLDQHEIALRELTSELQRMEKETPGMAVVIRGDGEGTFQHVADALAACKRAGIQRLDVAVRVTRQESR
ncbi:MAG: biopolymer transporter ExbD [Planctomycetes bacterium]|nr:biopolymer transporter ExbD [Planctomycetota bacterium]